MSTSWQIVERTFVKRERVYASSSPLFGRPSREYYYVILSSPIDTSPYEETKIKIRQDWRSIAGGGFECYWLPHQSPAEIDVAIAKGNCIEGQKVTRSALEGEIIPYKVGKSWLLTYDIFVHDGEDVDRAFAMDGHPRPTNENKERVIEVAKKLHAMNRNAYGDANVNRESQHDYDDDYGDNMRVGDNPYYNDALDLDQQSIEFWDSFDD